MGELNRKIKSIANKYVSLADKRLDMALSRGECSHDDAENIYMISNLLSSWCGHFLYADDDKTAMQPRGTTPRKKGGEDMDELNSK
ncbi:MAG: hypothetical protein LIO57_01695, partial [Oscillospiraceae bacterium]|nr:hypothetical protein [Oscillospiraceae bacterium]